jgi:vacuolar-type H+-ATPase subunit C/Vma6
VVVRARGLAGHLLDRETLRQLARSAGSSALASALENVGYWPAPTVGGLDASLGRQVERSIEHQILKRMALLVRWLEERAELFAPLLDLEARDALRIRIRQLAADGGGRRTGATGTRGGWPALRRLRAAIDGVTDLTDLPRALERVHSPHAAPLARAVRVHGGDPVAVESALDRSWASRAVASTQNGDEALRAWVADEIDLQNAWDALAGGTDSFLDGGRRLPRSRYEKIAATTDEPGRRRALAEAFRRSDLAGVFDDPVIGLEKLEARARAARIESARRRARRDPIGTAPILEVVLRLWAERVDLRCIGFGVAAGLSHETIVDRLVAT